MTALLKSIMQTRRNPFYPISIVEVEEKYAAPFNIVIDTINEMVSQTFVLNKIIEVDVVGYKLYDESVVDFIRYVRSHGYDFSISESEFKQQNANRLKFYIAIV